MNTVIHMKKWFLLTLLPVVCHAEIYDINTKKDPGYQYYACVNNESVRYSKTSEPAEVAAIAALQSCSEYGDRHVFRNGMAQHLTPVQKNELSNKLRETWKPLAIKIILDERLKNTN